MKNILLCFLLLIVQTLFAQNQLLDTLPRVTAVPHDEVGFTGKPYYKIYHDIDDLYKETEDTLLASLPEAGIKVFGIWLDYEQEEFVEIVIQIKKEKHWEEIYIETEVPFDDIELFFYQINNSNLLQFTYRYQFSFNRGDARGAITEIWNPETKRRYAELYIENYNYGSYMDPHNFSTSYSAVEYASEINFENGILTIVESKNLDFSSSTDSNEVETIIRKHEGINPKTSYKLENGSFVKQ